MKTAGTAGRSKTAALLPRPGEGSNQPVDPSDFFAGGEGTQADPYRIETEAQLRGFAEATQNGKLSTANLYIRLDARYRALG